MFGWFKNHELVGSSLLDQDNFYPTFIKDIRRAKTELVIESPFITSKRLNVLIPTLERILKRGVKVILNTKPLNELDPGCQLSTVKCIAKLQEIGVLVLFTGGHHRKIAIIDREVLYEGSLNILSQSNSCEFMRKTESKEMAEQTLNFIQIKHLVQ